MMGFAFPSTPNSPAAPFEPLLESTSWFQIRAWTAGFEAKTVRILRDREVRDTVSSLLEISVVLWLDSPPRSVIEVND